MHSHCDVDSKIFALQAVLHVERRHCGDKRHIRWDQQQISRVNSYTAAVICNFFVYRIKQHFSVYNGLSEMLKI